MNNMKAKLGKAWKVVCIIYAIAGVLLMAWMFSGNLGWDWHAALLAFGDTTLKVLGVMTVGWLCIFVKNRLKKANNHQHEKTQ